MNIKHFIGSFTTLAFTCTAAFADNATNALETSSSLELPTLEASAFYRTMKIERGMVENPESVFGYEIALEWYGLFGGIESCYDMTDINGSRGRLNEAESFLGYGYTFGDLTVKAAYIYKDCKIEDSNTQEVEAELEYETPWATPFIALSCDTKEKPGALYGNAGLSRDWELCEKINLVTTADVGFGDHYRNGMDFELERTAFREIHLGAALEIKICPHLKLLPAVDFYDSFTRAEREVYDKFGGFVCTAGCSLVADF